MLLSDRSIEGTIYDIQGFSVQDGPGIRTTVFEKGCPLKCPWCHSPESQRFEIQLSWQQDKCIGSEVCTSCMSSDVCPTGALSFDDTSKVVVDWSKCTECLNCATACPAGALTPWGKRMTVQEVVDRALRDKGFYKRSGGGVTVSGGEAMSQPEFTLNLLMALKEEGINTALDTTAFCTWEQLERTLPYTDLYLVDIKHMDSADHETVVGVPNELILENTKKLAASGAKIRVRVPVIPNFNDGNGVIDRLGDYCLTLGDSLSEVQILPYHSLGISKWSRIKREGKVFVAGAISDERIEEIRLRLDAMGLPVVVH